jgi:ribosomal protein S18 acetylase RimI-like enzyme
LILRSATEQDLASVLLLWEGAGGPRTVSDTWEGLVQLLNADRDALLLAEVDAKLIGSLIVAWDGWRGSFYKLVVVPDRRRQGVARALLKEGERRLRALGALRLTAIAVEENPAAMAFWRAAGYECQRARARFVASTECGHG